MKDAGLVTLVSFILVIIGGLNWLLVGLFRLDIVAMILGENSLLSRLIYIIIGLAAVYLIYMKVTKKD